MGWHLPALLDRPRQRLGRIITQILSCTCSVRLEIKQYGCYSLMLKNPKGAQLRQQHQLALRMISPNYRCTLKDVAKFSRNRGSIRQGTFANWRQTVPPTRYACLNRRRSFHTAPRPPCSRLPRLGRPVHPVRSRPGRRLSATHSGQRCDTGRVASPRWTSVAPPSFHRKAG